MFLFFQFSLLNINAMVNQDDDIEYLTQTLHKLSVDWIGWPKFLEKILEDFTVTSDPEVTDDIYRVSGSWEWDKIYMEDMYSKIISKIPEAKRVFDLSDAGIFYDEKGLKINQINQKAAHTC